MKSDKDIFLYNMLSRSVEKFIPIDANQVKMYVCGPTVYDFIHLGNARSIVAYDLLYRIFCFKYGKEKVNYTRNITNVDEKIIERCKLEKKSFEELTSLNIDRFHQNADYLSCEKPNFEPKVTENINEIISMIQILIEKGFAYKTDKGIYFNVSKYPDYGRLSGRNTSDMLSGVRINIDDKKESTSDFALWKTRNFDEYSFSSPFGYGIPGWHIECSVMSKKHLGVDFDVHGGGIDLIFPHHTNEIAQSVCANEGSIYAKYWVHNGMLTINAEKMSKSLNNFVTVHDVMKQGIKGEILRYFLISRNYRSPIDFNQKALNDAKSNLDYIYSSLMFVENNFLTIDENALPDEEFMGYLYDDMNTPLAISRIITLASTINKANDMKNKLDIASKLLKSCEILGIAQDKPTYWFKGDDLDENYINEKIKTRIAAKKNKDFRLADEIRNELFSNGIILEDNGQNLTTWKKK